MFKIGDHVRSIGMNSRDYGVGQIIDIKLNVATVVFNNQLMESFHFALLEKPKTAK